MRQERYFELDLARALAIVAVVMIHAASFYPWYNKSFSWSGYFVYHQVTSFAVPAFILLSGLLLTLTGKVKPFEYGVFIKRRLAFIFIPYCAWSAIYFLYRWPDLTLETAINDFLTGRPFFHLYFVAIILQLYILLPIFLWAAERFHPTHLVLAFLLQIAVVEAARHGVAFVFAKLGPALFVHWIFLFYVGCVIGANYSRFKGLCEEYISAVIGAAAALVVYKIGDYYYTVHYAKAAKFWAYAQVQTIDNIPYTVCFVAMCIYFGQRVRSSVYRSTISFIAMHSFGIYLCHMLFLRWLKIPFEAFNITSGNVTVFATLSASIVFSCLLTVIVKAAPAGKYIVGK